MALVALPFLLQSRFALTHVQAGLFITPMAVGTAVAAPVAGRLVERVAAGMLATMRLIGQTTGAVVVAFTLRLEGSTSMAPLLAASALAFAAALLGFFRAHAASAAQGYAQHKG